MASYFVLEQGEKGDWAEVVFHIKIPDINNSAGISFKQAYKEYKDPQSILPPILGDKRITKSVKDVIKCDVIEVRHRVKYSANLSYDDKHKVIKDFGNQLEIETIHKLIHKLDMWGTSN